MEHQKISSSKFTAKRNKLFCNKRYIQNPRYYIPDGALEGAVEMWPGGPKPPMEERLTTIAYDLIVPKKVNVYQPLELEWIITDTNQAPPFLSTHKEDKKMIDNTVE